LSIVAGRLYVVATPIGNLEDITLRALRILREVDLIAAEDTRVTRKLLSHYDIHTPSISYHQHSKGGRAREIVETLRQGKNVALVSDAGTPGISDPGHELIGMCIDTGIRIEPVPGPTAIISALVISGLPTAHFAFDGFPPRKERDRRAFFAALLAEHRTLCLYEAANRLIETLGTIHEVLPERRIVVVREATKKFEEVFRGSAAEAIEHFGKKAVKGEVVLLVEGLSAEGAQPKDVSDEEIAVRLSELVAAGESERDAVRRCAVEMNLPRRRVYALAISLRADRD
jgi:16S rRNA (cytidine1402-2'-O)-methyltransferase